MVAGPVAQGDRGAPSNSSDHRIRVLVALREGLERLAVVDALEREGMSVTVAGDPADVMLALEMHDPHVVVCDLDARAGAQGGEILVEVHELRPWVGLVAIASHASPVLAAGPGVRLPPSTVLLVKSKLSSMSEICHAVQRAIDQSQAPAEADAAHAVVVLTRSQAEILRLMAEGYSNVGIAQIRGTSVRAAESLVQRTLQALGIVVDEHRNARVLAVRRWFEGDIVVR